MTEPHDKHSVDIRRRFGAARMYDLVVSDEFVVVRPSRFRKVFTLGLTMLRPTRLNARKESVEVRAISSRWGSRIEFVDRETASRLLTVYPWAPQRWQPVLDSLTRHGFHVVTPGD